MLDTKIRQRLLKRIARANEQGHGPDFDMHGLEEEYSQLSTLLENTFKLREGKSCMVIGPSGSGKSMLVNRILHEQSSKYEFFTIKINGLLQIDDTAAIKEIARQLDQYLVNYNQLGKRAKLNNALMFNQGSINATMAMIVNILDKTRLDETETTVDERGFMVERKKMLMPIVFVIENIDVYTRNSKQTLLYNLFDIAQSNSSKTNFDLGNSKGTTVTVIGLTTKVTIRDSLEKRVKSRFSQRIIQLNKPKTLDEFAQCVYSMLCLRADGAEKHDNQLAETYNWMLRTSIHSKGSAVRKAIIRNYQTTKYLPSLQNDLLPLLIELDCQYDSVSDTKSKNLYRLKDLSQIELKMFICCCRVKIKSSVPCVNFDMVSDEYRLQVDTERSEIQHKLATVGRSLKSNQYDTSASALRTAWERLQLLELITPVANKSQLTKLVETSLEMDEIAAFISVQGLVLSTLSIDHWIKL